MLQMVLKPESTPDTRLVSKRSYVESHQAITEFEVLDSHGNAALVECTPLTGRAHEDQCYNWSPATHMLIEATNRIRAHVHKAIFVLRLS